MQINRWWEMSKRYLFLKDLTANYNLFIGFIDFIVSIILILTLKQ